ncbi:PhzF family phenazine biosynthesis isomerase [Streptomyces sp. SID3343]|uniref:PhzF family phenazine biosynthesis protein n=1 Tax=Streptomyces sp. SID3343 TaxID=2690260 RepID=UPI001367A4C6|nr:PhzF family phenazine biosynthesis isomerase [Streptomyces sp. SID3343]MYV96877.1 PhzF family phenazine biosynthesis isomerase [Streptomyces sp. SID3343]
MRIHVVDAFTDRPFRGNPAGVCLPDAAHAEDVAWMQSVAAELNHSETAFAVPSTHGEADFALRWFTPVTEVDLCGHATLATAHVLFTQGVVAATRIRFATRSGVLTATLGSEGVVLDFPALPPRDVPAPAELGLALGVEPVAVAAGGDDLLVEVASPAVVRAVDPDSAALGALPYRAVIVTAAGGERGDFVSRVFAPSVGVAEDPVTGSAHCVLGPYWAPRLDRRRMTGVQLSARGGTVGVELHGDRVLLFGQAVTTLEGELLAE